MSKENKYEGEGFRGAPLTPAVCFVPPIKIKYKIASIKELFFFSFHVFVSGRRTEITDSDTLISPAMVRCHYL